MTTSTTSSPNSGSGKNPKTNNTQDKKEAVIKEQQNKAVTWAHEQFDRMKEGRAGQERQWYMNLAFYFGKQNVVYRTGNNSVIYGSGGILKVPPAPPWRFRFVCNRIRPAIRTEITKLTSQKPNAFVVPSSNEDLDMQAAQAGEQLWDSIYRSRYVNRKVRQAVFWSQTCGTGFLKTYWDPMKDDPAVKPEDSPEAQMAREILGTESKPTGDICIEPETPFHILVPDLAEEDLENQPYLIHAQVKSIDYLNYCFPGINFQGSKKEELIDPSFINLLGAKDLNSSHKGVLCLEVWVKPGASKLFPQGGMFTVAGDTFIQGHNGWPYSHGQYPFAKIDHIPSGKFYAESTIVDLIPVQKEYNRTRSQTLEIKNSSLKPKLLAEEGSITVSKITSEPGQVIEYKGGYAPPQWAPVPEVSSAFYQELEQLLRDFEDISGQHEVTQGKVPAGITAATAISYLQEQDESKLSHTFDSLEEALEKTAQQTLNLIHSYWDEPRLVKVVGADGAFDVKTFRGADLKGNLDIRVEGGSALPVSRAAKQAFIMDLMKMGFIDPNKGLEVMEIGGIGKIYESIQIDVRQAQRENSKLAALTPELIQEHQMLQQEQQMTQQPDPMMADPMNPMSAEQPPVAEQDPNVDPMTGEAVEIPPIIPVNTWDEHKIHIEIHNKYRKSQQFEFAPEHVKAAFEEHVRMHVMALSETMVAEQGAEENTEESSNESNNPSQEPAPEVNNGPAYG